MDCKLRKIILKEGFLLLCKDIPHTFPLLQTGPIGSRRINNQIPKFKKIIVTA